MDEQLADDIALLRALSAAALSALPGEPWLHRKRLLAEHARDDVTAADALATAPGTEGERASQDPLAFEDVYGTVKPELAARLRARLAALDPREDEERFRALLRALLAQERHVDELSTRPRPPAPDPPEGRPARDPFLPDPPPHTGDDARDDLDARLAELEAAIADGERAAEAGDAAGAAGLLARAAAIDAQLTRAGTPWGSRPVALS
jgi:hypothetical protein